MHTPSVNWNDYHKTYSLFLSLKNPEIKINHIIFCKVNLKYLNLVLSTAMLKCTVSTLSVIRLLVSELESDLKDTVIWDKKRLEEK